MAFGLLLEVREQQFAPLELQWLLHELRHRTSWGNPAVNMALLELGLQLME
jgi:hypothetical protein